MGFRRFHGALTMAMRAAMMRQPDGSYRIWIEGTVGVILAATFAEAMQTLYRLLE